jgi:hypothetical protein
MTLRCICAVRVSPDELIESAEHVLTDLGNGIPAAIVIEYVAQRFGGDTDKGTAVFFRMQALAWYLRRLSVAQFLNADESGDALFAAAAVHPLVQSGGHIVFEPTSFQKRRRQLASELDVPVVH